VSAGTHNFNENLHRRSSSLLHIAGVLLQSAKTPIIATIIDSIDAKALKPFTFGEFLHVYGF
jgi:hypothetical protein